MSSLLIETAGREVVDGLCTELVRLGEHWLRLVSWLIEENGRAFASLSAPLALWLVLLAIVAVRALFPPFAGARLRMQPPTGGPR